MMDNYPPGAANDPNAPYNETLAQEVDVTVRTRLTKDTCIFANTHDCVEWEIDPDTGRREGIHFVEYDDVKENYENQEDSPYQIIQKCLTICLQLKRDGQRRYAGVNIERLADSCDGWEEEELTVE